MSIAQEKLQRKLWDLREFNKINLPEVVFVLDQKERFSRDILTALKDGASTPRN